MTQFFNGDTITLECQGSLPGYRFLNGKTVDGTVGLDSGELSGTQWLVELTSEINVVTFYCQGDIPGGNRYLDGRTANNTVGLAPNTGPDFSGTKWRVNFVVDENLITLECLGNIDGNRFLDGETANGTVRLAPDTRPAFSGTLWKFEGP